MVMCSQSRGAPLLDSDLFSECLLCTRRKWRPLAIIQLQVKTSFGQEWYYSLKQMFVVDLKEVSCFKMRHRLMPPWSQLFYLVYEVQFVVLECIDLTVSCPQLLLCPKGTALGTMLVLRQITAVWHVTITWSNSILCKVS